MYKAVLRFPICMYPVGLIKRSYPNSEVYITPTKKEVDELLKLKVECIALDATTRLRPKQGLQTIINYIRTISPETIIMGDCATYEDVLCCNQLGLDLIGTTLRGYTVESRGMNNLQDNYAFIQWCVANSTCPVIAEGGIWEPSQVKEIMQLGVKAVVVGSAITRPKEITKRFMRILAYE